MATSSTKKKTSTKKAVSTAKAWKRQSTMELELPSGNVCLVKRPGMEKLLNAGVMPDNLTPIAMAEIKKAQSGGKPDANKKEGIDEDLMSKFLEEDGALEGMFRSFDKATVMCVVEPPVRLHFYTEKDELAGQIPKGFSVNDDVPEEEREEDILYTDDVDMEDKMFIFQFVVGGSKDIESFRSEFGDVLAASSDGDDVPGTSE
jgi:hypothetical protein